MKRLLYPALAAVALSLVAPPDVQAQDEPQFRFVRESLYQLNYGDMLEWNEMFLGQIAPILRDMTEAGTIQGFSAWQHDTGGDHNWRFAMRYYDFASIETALAEFQTRTAEAMPAEAMTKLQAMMGSHKDQIWEVMDLNVPGGVQVNYMYNAEFMINPVNLPKWNAAYEETWKPLLSQAVADGKLLGWVVLGHVHGGPNNWKLVMLHSDWDNMDDVWEATMAGFGEQMEAVFSMVEYHYDHIWVPVRPDGG